MVRVNRRRSIASLSATVAMLLATATHAQTFKFELPAQPLQQSLRAISQQANVNILFDSDTVDGLYAPALSGDLTVQEAIRLLTSDKKLTVQQPALDTITVSRLMTATSTGMRRISDVREQDRRSMRVAQAGTVGGQAAASVGADDSKQDPARIQLEEVIVTGSHIRGAHNFSSPVLTFDRKDIEASGHATTQQFIQGLSQNFNSVTDMMAGDLNGEQGSFTYNGAGVNLRGLGSDATLVLLNGRRLPAAGDASFVDVSLIPLGAVERIEILTDGASATYGSDAVGGVVNFVTRKDFEGAETRLRYGSVTDGDHDELQAGQMLGRSWESGQLMLSYDYLRRTDLEATERDFLRPAVYLDSLKVIPAMTRHSALAMISQQLTDGIELISDLSFGKRESAYSMAYFGPKYDYTTEVEQYSGTLGLTADIAKDWQVRLTGQFGQSESDRLRSGGASISSMAEKSRMWLVELAADGSLVHIPGGDIRLALGGQFRYEHLARINDSTPMRLDREIAAAYAEVNVPLVGATNRRTGIEQLELTIAGRLEDYSDFGSSSNPKLGLAWRPVDALNIRGTWGTSFKAPLLTQLNPADVYPTVYREAFADRSGTADVLYLIGSREKLDPEESKNWTAGFDIQALGAELSMTYFDIDYTDRVRNPLETAYDLFSVLLDPIYERLITRDPPAETIDAYLNQYPATCYYADYALCPMPAAQDIDAIVDSRLTNVSSMRVSGVDVSFRYTWSSLLGNWGLQMNGTRLLRNSEQFIEGVQSTEQMNNVWLPVDLKVRGSLSLSRGPLTTAAFINYTDDYRDKRTSPLAGSSQREHVSSWTTVDLTLQYEIGQLIGGAPERTAVSLSGVNVFDRDPPFIGSLLGIHYDGVNASALGRFIALQLTVAW